MLVSLWLELAASQERLKRRFRFLSGRQQSSKTTLSCNSLEMTKSFNWRPDSTRKCVRVRWTGTTLLNHCLWGGERRC